MIKPLSSKERDLWNVRIDIFDNNRDSWGTMAYFYDDTLINADQLPNEEDCKRIATECLERYNRVLQSDFRGQSRILCKLEKRGKTQFAVVRRMRREAGLCLPALTAR